MTGARRSRTGRAEGSGAPLRTRLALVALLALLPMCLLVVLLSTQYYRLARRSAHLDAAALVRMLATEQQAHIDAANTMLNRLAVAPELAQPGRQACALLAGAARLLANDYAAIGMTDAAGRPLCGPALSATASASLARAQFLHALAAGRFFTAPYQIDAGNGRAVLTAVLPLRDRAGTVHGSVHASIDLAWIGRSKPISTLPSQSIVVLFDQHGKVLLRHPEPSRWQGKAIGEAAWFGAISASGAAGVIDMAAHDGQRRLVAFDMLASSGGAAYLAVGIPGDGAVAALHSQMLWIGGGLMLALLAAMLIAWYAGQRWIVDRIGQLAAVVQRIGGGATDARCGARHADDEIGALARTIDQMADAIGRREQNLDLYYFGLNQHAIISRTDAAGVITFVNERFCQISGYAAAELLGQDHRMLNSGLHPASFFEDMWSSIAAGKVWHGVIRNRASNGSYYWVVSTIVPELGSDAVPLGYLSIRTDITETLKIEQALQRSEEQYRLLADNMLDVILLHDVEGRMQYASPSAARLLGYSPGQLAGTGLLDLVRPDSRADLAGSLQGLVFDGYRHVSAVLPMLRRDGATVWVELTAALVAADGELARIQSTLHDVSLRKAAEDSLRLHDKAIRASASGIVLFSAGPDHVLEFANPAFENTTGYTLDQLSRLGMRFLLGRIVGPDAAAIREIVSASRDGNVLLQFERRNGALAWLDCALSPIRNANEVVTHYVIAVSDVTERMQMVTDLTKARDAAEQAHHAKSEFLARMTHELRTPLNFILGFAQLLELPGGTLDAVQRDRVERIIEAGWHLRKLVDEVLDLARIDAGRLALQLRDVELAALLAECIGMVEPGAAERQLRIEQGAIPASGAVVRADAMRLKQVLLNLLSNAIKFNRTGGTVGIGVAAVAGGQVRITITDTGPGIARERHGELFKPFGRLDADQAEIPGSGVGLALCLRFMELMEGRIGVDSDAGAGCAFWIELAGAASEPIFLNKCEDVQS